MKTKKFILICYFLKMSVSGDMVNLRTLALCNKIISECDRLLYRMDKFISNFCYRNFIFQFVPILGIYDCCYFIQFMKINSKAKHTFNACFDKYWQHCLTTQTMLLVTASHSMQFIDTKSITTTNNANIIIIIRRCRHHTHGGEHHHHHGHRTTHTHSPTLTRIA